MVHHLHRHSRGRAPMASQGVKPLDNSASQASSNLDSSQASRASRATLSTPREIPLASQEVSQANRRDSLASSLGNLASSRGNLASKDSMGNSSQGNSASRVNLEGSQASLASRVVRDNLVSKATRGSLASSRVSTANSPADASRGNNLDSQVKITSSPANLGSSRVSLAPHQVNISSNSKVSSVSQITRRTSNRCYLEQCHGVNLPINKPQCKSSKSMVNGVVTK